MVRLYLDVETYRPVKERPFVDERIIALGVVVDETPYDATSMGCEAEAEIYSEWRGMDEKKITSKAFEIVERALSAHRFTVVCGFDILRFDIPLLISKAENYVLMPIDQSSLLWHNTHTIDFLQELLVANGNLFKGLKLSKIVEVAKNLGLQPPDLTETGAAVAQLYDSKQYADIEEHLRKDLRAIRWLDLVGAKELISASINTRGALFRGV